MIQKRKILSISGIIAPILFASFVWIGGEMNTDYNFLSETISALNQREAPNKNFLDWGFALSYICMALFGFGLYRSGRRASDKYRRLIGILLMIAGVMCFLMIVLFPADATYSDISFAGMMHHIIAVLMAMMAMSMILFWELEFKHDKGFKVYSIVSITLIFLAALATWASNIMFWPLQGLFERISIGTFLQWMIVISIKELKESFGTSGRITAVREGFTENVKNIQ